jgi:hypothetical protein
LKLLLDELAGEAGVEVRFFTQVIDAEVAGGRKRVEGVVLHNIEGYRYVRAKTFIDATGDGVLADLCGVPSREAGRDTPRIMPSTLCSLFAGIDWSRIKMGGWHGTGPQRIVPANQQEMVEKAIAEGHFSQPDYHVPGMIRVGKSTGNLNAPHLFDLNALRCKSLTDGMIMGRKLAQEYREFYRKYLPGFENIEHVATATLMGVRESRWITGEYVLNHDDYLARRHFPDQIGLFNKSVDIHPYDGSREALQRHLDDDSEGIGPGESFGLPYGILVPKGWSNLWVAGRCNSSDIRVSATIRVQPAAAMMGQAAGTAAVQAINSSQSADALDTAQLVETLRKAGAYLPQEELSKEMTRG